MLRDENTNFYAIACTNLKKAASPSIWQHPACIECIGCNNYKGQMSGTD